MKRPWLPVAFLVLALVAGCGNGGDDDDDNGIYLLEAGTYLTSLSYVDSDGCNTQVTPAELNGKEWTLTINGNSVHLVTTNSDVTLTKSGDTLARDQSGDLDYAPDFDCVVTITAITDGDITADNEFDLVESFQVQYKSGTECDFAVDATLPCETNYGQHFAIQTM